MPGPMPYYLEKGPILSVLEDYANRGGRDGMIDLLLYLRDTTKRVVECGAFDTPSLDFTIPATPFHPKQQWTGTLVKKHINEHWFNDNNLGWWVGCKADNVEGVVRDALARAIEVALGVDHLSAPTRTALESSARHHPWAIELFWKCGQNWFEAWGMWRHGVVTVMLATPAEDVGNDVVWMTPVAPPDGVSQSSPYELNPMALGRSGQQGMFVVAQRHNVAQGGYGATYVGGPEVASQRGAIAPPPAGTRYVSSGDVVVVVPAEARGGVLPTRRAWRPT